jgi:hypothetical protein
MPNASGSNHSMAYVPEVTYGVTPATPTFKPLRNSGATLSMSKDTLQSEELRSDRQLACYRHGNRQIGGNVDIELVWADFDDMLQAVLCGTWAADNLIAGITRRSFTIERYFADINTRIRYTGCEANELNLTIAPNAVVKGSLTFVGKDQDPINTMIAGSTYPNPVGGCPFDSFTGAIKEGNVTIGIVTQVELKIANGIEPNFVVGSKTTVETSIGTSMVTGTLTTYFSNVTMMNKFINETSSSLELELVNEAGDKLIFNLPNIKYNGGQPDVSGPGAITIALPFQALYSPAILSQIRITRDPL